MSRNVERLEAWEALVRECNVHDTGLLLPDLVPAFYRALLAAWRYIDGLTARIEHCGSDTLTVSGRPEAQAALDELISPGGAATREDADGPGIDHPHSPPGEPSLADLVRDTIWRTHQQPRQWMPACYIVSVPHARAFMAYVAATEATNPEAAARLREEIRCTT